MVLFTSFFSFFPGSALVTLNAHPGRMLLAVNMCVIKFAVWTLARWEEGKWFYMTVYLGCLK